MIPEFWIALFVTFIFALLLAATFAAQNPVKPVVIVSAIIVFAGSVYIGTLDSVSMPVRIGVLLPIYVVGVVVFFMSRRKSGELGAT